jgi:hypothetical protein
MNAAFQWWDLDAGGGVLELHEHLTPTGPALELHLKPTRAGTLAVWVLSTEDEPSFTVPVGLA